MKYSRRCSKIAYNSEQEAWEYVIHYRREGKSWTEPYLCKCGKWHTTGKHLHSDRIPWWVKQLANDKARMAREKRTVHEMTLSLLKQKEAIAQLPKVEPEPSWKRIMRELLSRI